MSSHNSLRGSIRIFISYARDDDEPFVERLWHYLENEGFSVWWDRQAMESRGQTFLTEIRQAIDSANRVLLIVGPRAKEKPYVEVEWRHALRAGVVVTPLLRLGDYTDVPKALRLLHTEDVRASVPEQKALEQVRRIIGTPVPPMGPLVGAVPRLPSPYLERADRLDELRSRVLIDAYEPIDLEPDQRITSITGMGGIGKTVLAAALAQLPEVRRSFSDGVYWIPVGRGADLLRTLTRVGIAIGDDSTQGYIGIPEARLLLAKKLATMNCLLVLDDVWKVDVAEALHTAAGKTVRILLTGRKRKLFASAGVHEVAVDELTTDEALDLLAGWSETPRNQLPREAKEIADECGNLPLALAMVGASIRRQPNRWSYALERLKNADLSKIKRDLPDYAYETLDRAMLVSFEELDEGLQQRYLDFAAIPEDVAAPAVMISKWWTHEGMDSLDVTEALDDLVDRSLLRVDEHERYTLHDVQRDFLVMRTEKRPLHERWLTAFAAQNPNGWASAEDDGYLFDHLDHHLRSAGREAEWRGLLLSFSWLQRKIMLRGFPAVLLDLAAYSNDQSLGALYRVSRRTAHILTNDPKQFAAQLIARLEPTPELQTLLAEARGRFDGVWLRPITRSLSEEGEPTLAVFRGREIDGHAGTPRSIALSPDGRLIASGGGSSNDLTVKVWSTDAAKLVRTYENAVLPSGSTALAFIGDGGRIAAAGPGDVRLYTLEAEEPVARHTFDDSDVTALCSDPSSGTAMIGFRNGRVLTWDPTTDALSLLRAADDRPVAALACASAARRLVILFEGIVECRDTKSGALIDRSEHDWNSSGSNFGWQSVFISQDGSRVFFGNPPRSWSIGSKATVMEQIQAQVVGLSDDGTIMLIAPDAFEIEAVETESARQIRHIRNWRQISCVALSKDGRAAATGDFEHDVKLWDLTEATEEKPEWQLRGSVWNLALSDDSRFAIFAREGGYELWDTTSGTAIKDEKSIGSVQVVRRGRPVPDPEWKALRAKFEKVLGVGEDDVYGMQDPLGVLAVSMTGNRAISAVVRRAKGSDSEELPYPGGDEGYPVMLWNLKKIREPVLLRGHMRDISCADITADGRWALTGSRGRLLRLWDLDNRNCIKILRGHRGIVFGCALTDDARFAISGSEDMTVCLWDLERGEPLFTFAASSAVSTCDISRDGSVALAAEVSGRVHTFAVENKVTKTSRS